MARLSSTFERVMTEGVANVAQVKAGVPVALWFGTKRVVTHSPAHADTWSVGWEMVVIGSGLVAVR